MRRARHRTTRGEYLERIVMVILTEATSEAGARSLPISFAGGAICEVPVD
jgi:hypothetical protein